MDIPPLAEHLNQRDAHHFRSSPRSMVDLPAAIA
jgi:hypothetical protein